MRPAFKDFILEKSTIEKGFIVVVEHSEATNCDLDKVYELIGNYEEIFVRDKKEFLHIVPLKQLSDIHFISPTGYTRPISLSRFFL